MGREVRRVPADWQHPKTRQFDHRGQWVERYEPLLDGDWPQAAKEWDASRERWERGEFPDYAGEESRRMPFDQWEGRRPYSGDYMPQWPAAERTHLMMYEDTSEGTPISPAFETPEELARWLVDNGASSFGSSTGTYEGWLSVARGGWAPSMIVSDGVVSTGVDSLAALAASAPGAPDLAQPQPGTGSGKLGDGATIRCRKCGEQTTIEFNRARDVSKKPACCGQTPCAHPGVGPCTKPASPPAVAVTKGASK